jgi:hypothetical protein
MKNVMEEQPVIIPAPLTPEINNFLDRYVSYLMSSRHGFTPIHVDDISSKVAHFYEVVRKVIDWKDDAALRRGAIERILKRILFPKLTGITTQVTAAFLAESITIELIRGGHLPNDTIPRERIAIATESIEKHLFFLGNSTSSGILKVKEKINYVTFIIEIMACEIEEILVNPAKEYGLIDTMTTLLDKRIRLMPKDQLPESEKRKLIYISVCLSLYGLDDNFIFYQLLKSKFPFWHHPNEDQMKIINRQLDSIWKNLQTELQSPLMKKFMRITERLDTAFVLIDDIFKTIDEKPNEILPTFTDKEKLTALITEAYQKRYQTLKTRLFRLAVFSTLSVFLSNWVTFYIVEVPMASIFYEGFNFWAAAMDFAIPTAVMFALVSIIRPPAKENEKKALNATLGFVYQDEKQELYQIRIIENKKSIFHFIMNLLYFIFMSLVFYGVAYIFYIARIPITSVVFDTLTIALTVFAAVTIRNKANELNVDEKTNFSDFLLDIFSVPVAKVGSILAAKWKEYNIVSILFNFIIETPFALILDFIGRWSEFIKERRVELH